MNSQPNPAATHARSTWLPSAATCAFLASGQEIFSFVLVQWQLGMMNFFGEEWPFSEFFRPDCYRSGPLVPAGKESAAASGEACTGWSSPAQSSAPSSVLTVALPSSHAGFPSAGHYAPDGNAGAPPVIASVPAPPRHGARCRPASPTHNGTPQESSPPLPQTAVFRELYPEHQIRRIIWTPELSGAIARQAHQPRWEWGERNSHSR
jgi:hypothetical protein